MQQDNQKTPFSEQHELVKRERRRCTEMMARLPLLLHVLCVGSYTVVIVASCWWWWPVVVNAPRRRGVVGG